MACELPAGQDYVVKRGNLVSTRKTPRLAETFFSPIHTGAALHQRHTRLHEPWGVRWSSQVVKSCPLSHQEFSHRQFSIMGSSRFFSNRKSLTDKKILWRTCLHPGTSTIGTARPQSRWIFCYFQRPAQEQRESIWPGDSEDWRLGSRRSSLSDRLQRRSSLRWGATTWQPGTPFFFNNIVVEIEWCPGCCIHTSPQGAWRPAWQDLCLREPQPSCTTAQHGGLGPNITWHDQVLNTDGRFNMQHLTCFG